MHLDGWESVQVHVREKRRWKKYPCAVRGKSFVQFKDNKVCTTQIPTIPLSIYLSIYLSPYLSISLYRAIYLPILSPSLSLSHTHTHTHTHTCTVYQRGCEAASDGDGCVCWDGEGSQNRPQKPNAHKVWWAPIRISGGWWAPISIRMSNICGKWVEMKYSVFVVFFRNFFWLKPMRGLEDQAK